MRPSRAVPLTLLIGIVVRLPFWIEALRTPLDGDTSIIGLMARHPLHGTALWGQPYGSPLEAWLIAPLLAALGPTQESVRLGYFLLGLALIPVGYLLGRQLHPAAALPTALLLACPPPYLLLLAALPPPFYSSTLVICGLLLSLTIAVGRQLDAGRRPVLGLVGVGLLAGLGLWTHLMLGSVIVVCTGYLGWRARRRPWLLAAAVIPLLLASAPGWWRALTEAQATGVVAFSGRSATFTGHLGEVLPALHRPLGGLLGTHVPVIPDDPEHVVIAPRSVAAGLVLIYGLSLIAVIGAARRNRAAGLLLAAAALTLAVFPLPLRSGPETIRFLTPLYLPLAALVAWMPIARSKRAAVSRRSVILVLLLACLHLAGAGGLLKVWRETDRAAAPFLLPDLTPVLRELETHAIRRGYASYGPAYRLTFESQERVIVSQPWNERFRHYPLPYLDEVRFAKHVAWILTPAVPTDLPPPHAFEASLGAIGGRWERTQAGPATLYFDFEPPFSPSVIGWPGGGVVADGDLDTALEPPVDQAMRLDLPSPMALDGLALVAPRNGPRLPRSVDVDVLFEGAKDFETLARRRRRGERQDLRWVNGHPQAVLDHDLLAVALGGRRVAAVRLAPVASTEAWAIAEILLHPAEAQENRRPWDEWLDPHLSWQERRLALERRPLPVREDWYYRLLLASRH